MDALKRGAAFLLIGAGAILMGLAFLRGCGSFVITVDPKTSETRNAVTGEPVTPQSGDFDPLWIVGALTVGAGLTLREVLQKNRERRILRVDDPPKLDE